MQVMGYTISIGAMHLLSSSSQENRQWPRKFSPIPVKARLMNAAKRRP